MMLIKKIILRIFKYECKILLAITKPKIVFVCGSTGKSTVIELIKSSLPKEYKIKSTEHNKNSKLDVLATILELKIIKKLYFLYPYWLLVGLLNAIFAKNEKKILILEIQIKNPRDVDFFVSFMKPDIILFTFLPKVPEFFSNFSSRKEFENEHFKVFNFIKPGGTLIYLNKEENIKEYLKQNKRKDLTYISCGESDSDLIYKDCDCQLDVERLVATVSAKFSFNGFSGIFNIKAFGLHLPAMMSLILAFADNLGVKVFLFPDLFYDYKPIPHRLNVLKGNNKTIVIDDTYEESLFSTMNAIRTIKCIKLEKSTIIILGDMQNLGKLKEEAHNDLLYESVQNFDKIIVHGAENKNACLESHDVAKIFNLQTFNQIKDFLDDNVTKGNLILVKGSRKIPMKKIIDYLTKE